MDDKVLIDLIKNNLAVKLDIDKEYTDEPGWYGEVTIVRARVKVYFKNELIFEDSDSESVSCSR